MTCLLHPVPFFVSAGCSAVLFPMIVIRWATFSSLQPSSLQLLFILPMLLCFVHYTATEAVGPSSFSFASCVSVLILSSSFLLFLVRMRRKRSCKSAAEVVLLSIVPFVIFLQSLATLLIWINDVSSSSSSLPTLCGRTGTVCSMIFSLLRVASFAFSHPGFNNWDQTKYCATIVASHLGFWYLFQSLPLLSSRPFFFLPSSRTTTVAVGGAGADAVAWAGGDDSSSRASQSTDNTDSLGNFTSKFILRHLFHASILALVAVLTSQLGFVLRRRALVVNHEGALFLAAALTTGETLRAVVETLAAAAAGEAFANAMLVMCEERDEGRRNLEDEEVVGKIGLGGVWTTRSEKEEEEEGSSSSSSSLSASDEEEGAGRNTAATRRREEESSRTEEGVGRNAPPQDKKRDTAPGEEESQRKQGAVRSDNDRGEGIGKRTSNFQKDKEGNNDEDEEEVADNLSMFGHAFGARNIFFFDDD